MVPYLLRGSVDPGAGPRRSKQVFSNFAVVEEYLDLPEWLHKSEPDLYAKLYGGPVPVDALQAAAVNLGITDVDEHAVRIRRGMHDDPAQAIGSAKELLETVLKSILDAEWSPHLYKTEYIVPAGPQPQGPDILEDSPWLEGPWAEDLGVFFRDAFANVDDARLPEICEQWLAIRVPPGRV
jgi:hypothetical protein